MHKKINLDLILHRKSADDEYSLITRILFVEIVSIMDALDFYIGFFYDGALKFFHFDISKFGIMMDKDGPKLGSFSLMNDQESARIPLK